MSDSAFFPKVLLLDFSFDNTTGMGVTLTNLFKDWPTDRIGVLSDHVNPELCDRIRPCSFYIGISKPIGLLPQNSNSVVSRQRNPFRNLLKRLYHRMGFDELFYNPIILDDSLASIQEFSPDIVFCGLGNLNRMRLCERVHELLPMARIVLFIVDDWVNSRVAERWPSFIWSKKYDQAFRRVLSFSSGNLSICEEMSKVYLDKYGVVFYPFHNPVDISYWVSLSPTHKYGTDTVSILYVGKINVDTEECLLDCCRVVEELNSEGRRICFDVYSPDYRIKFDLFNQYEHCSLFPPVPHELIPELTKSYSALLLTLGFSPHSVKYVKLSMPTKLSEYLASGLPTILYCPEEIALSHYVHSNDCAIICNRKGKEQLKQALLRLFNKEDVRMLF